MAVEWLRADQVAGGGMEYSEAARIALAWATAIALIALGGLWAWLYRRR